MLPHTGVPARVAPSRRKGGHTRAVLAGPRTRPAREAAHNNAAANTVWAALRWHVDEPVPQGTVVLIELTKPTRQRKTWSRRHYVMDDESSLQVVEAKGEQIDGPELQTVEESLTTQSHDAGVQNIVFQGVLLPHYQGKHLRTLHQTQLREHANLLRASFVLSLVGRAAPMDDHVLGLSSMSKVFTWYPA